MRRRVEPVAVGGPPIARAVLPIALSAALLLWPALLNGYPLVFSDTGTYLSQAVHHYLGWDRPVFYSLFVLPLHLTLTTWPIVVAQAVIAAHLLHLVLRTLWPGASAWRLLPIVAVLAGTTSLPWFTAELMPDLFTGLLMLAMSLLLLLPDRLRLAERWWLAGVSAFSIAAHLSSLPLALGLLALLLPLRRVLGAAMPLGRAGMAFALAPPLLAVLAMISVNLAGHGRAAIAPFGNVFVLARVLYDGPGMDALRRNCPASGWRLCSVRDEMPPRADDFIWHAQSPLNLAGGPKLVSAEADDIILAAIREEPRRELRALLGNAARQLAIFGTGDGLQPWPHTVAPWIARDFPAREFRWFQGSRQSRGGKLLPRWMQELHAAASIAGVIAAAGLLVPALRQRNPAAGFIAASFLALLLNALIAGGLSGPHARYQSRVMWLPVFVALLAVPPSVRAWAGARALRQPPLARGAGGRFRPRALGTSSPNCTAAHAVFWTGAEAAVAAGFAFVSAFLVARIVGPAEVGVGAAAVAVNVLLWVAVNALFADAMVQRPALAEPEAASAFWASTAVGCLAACVQVAAGWPLARSLGDPRLVVMAFALAAPMPLVGAGGAVQGILTRGRAYRLLACRTLIGQGLGTAAGIGCALAGAGAWALVVQQATSAAIGATVLLLGAGWRPRVIWRWRSVREMLALGTPLAASTLVQAGRYRVFALLIGGTAGAVSLGQVHMAFRLVDALRDLAFTALWRLMLPPMSEAQHDLAILRTRNDRFLAASALALFPLCGAMLLSVRPLVALALGPAWAPSGAASLLLVAATAWLFLTFPSGVAVVARGAPRLPLYANIGFTLALVAGVLTLRPSDPIQATAVWLGVQILVAPFAIAIIARALNTTSFALLRAGLPALALTLAGVGAALLLPGMSPLIRIAARLIVAAAVIVPGTLLILRAGGRAAFAITPPSSGLGAPAMRRPTN